MCFAVTFCFAVALVGHRSVPHVNQYFIVNRFISTRKKPVEIEQKRFLSTVFCVANLS